MNSCYRFTDEKLSFTDVNYLLFIIISHHRMPSRRTRSFVSFTIDPVPRTVPSKDRHLIFVE